MSEVGARIAVRGVLGITRRVDISLQMTVFARFNLPRAGRAAFAAAAIAAVLAPVASAASAPGDALSPRLAEPASPTVRSAPRAAQAARLSLSRNGPGSLLRLGGRVLVDVRFDHGAADSVDSLRAAGAQVLHVGRRYETVTVAVKLADLIALGSVPGVAGAGEVLTPIVRGADCGGSVRSEGDAQLGAATARSNWGVDGSGVTVGILSDSFDRNAAAVTHAAGDVGSGDLPGPGSPCGSTTPVGVLDDAEAGGEDEGRAMAQIVHDLAPGASIDFATAFTGELEFAANIRALAGAGARVIADDVAYLEEPFFQDGPVAQAVNEVTGSGVSYFSAAGNDNLIDAEGRDIASWEAPKYRDSGACPAAIVEFSEEVEKAEEEKGDPTPQGIHPSHCMDFDPGAGKDRTFGISVESGRTLSLDLQWAEPWFGVGTDIDAFLLGEDGKLVEVEGSKVLSAEDNVNGSQTPFEFLSWENFGPAEEVQLVINRFSGGEPRLKFALLENGRGVSETEYPNSSGGDVVGPTIFGHSGAAGAISVAAVPFDNSSKPERYSSRGPVTHYFGPVVDTSPAATISPQVIAKPDLVATDCGVTTFFAFQDSSGAWRFCGTSAAAPHAAAVAALIRQANPGATEAQVRNDLLTTARPVGAFGAEAVGAGLVNADSAVNALALAPTITITEAPKPLSRVRRPTVQFTANRQVAFACSIDGGAPQPCASPHLFPAKLSDGRHGFAVTGIDLGGRVGSSGVVSFTIDTRAPRTSIVKHPPKRILTRHRRARAIFRFRSSEPGSTFVCKVDRDLLRPCGRRLALRLEAGRHAVRVRARDEVGNVDPTPAVFRFRVKRAG